MKTFIQGRQRVVRAVQFAGEGQGIAERARLGHLLAVEQPRLNGLVLGVENGQDVGLAEIRMPQGDVGGDILATGHIAGHEKDSVRRGRGERVDFRSPLNRCHDASPVLFNCLR